MVSQSRSTVRLSASPCSTGTPSLRARAATTGFCSVDMTSTFTPERRSSDTPIPSERLTSTISRPSESM